jgi:hypothetical protein
MTEKQKNKIRIKYLKEGISILKKGRFPDEVWDWSVDDFKKNMYLSSKGMGILFLNGLSGEQKEIKLNNFIYSYPYDIKASLHNWNRFLNLVSQQKSN